MELRSLLVVDVKAGDASTVSLLAAGFQLSGLIPSRGRFSHFPTIYRRKVKSP